jgi:ribonuclease HII
MQLGLPAVAQAIRGKVTLGIDEAGRGPILGPMVMAAVALDTSAARVLTRAGLADSKQFGAGADARARRAELAALVRARACFVAVEVVEADEIDARVAHNELNVLERERAIRMIERAPRCARILADGARMFGQLRDRFPELRAYDRGEDRHASVAAASVVAKDLRDAWFVGMAERYRAEFGELGGGGYMNAATRAFLRAYHDRHGCLPPEARRSWTIQM